MGRMKRGALRRKPDLRPLPEIPPGWISNHGQTRKFNHHRSTRRGCETRNFLRWGNTYIGTCIFRVYQKTCQRFRKLNICAILHAEILQLSNTRGKISQWPAVCGKSNTIKKSKFFEKFGTKILKYLNYSSNSRWKSLLSFIIPPIVF